METPVTYTVNQLASCDRPERLAILYQVWNNDMTPEEADEALERLTAERINAAMRGWIGDDSLPLAEERSVAAVVLYGEGEL